MKICKADYNTKIIETVWDYAEAMLRLWYGVVSHARSQLYWENRDDGLGKIKIVMGRN